MVTFPVEWVDSCDSTNRVLADRVRSGGHDPVLLIARHQTAGKGRLGRSWEAPAGSAFTGSWMVPVDGTGWANRPWLVSFAVALAVQETVSNFISLPHTDQPDDSDQLMLKWPNDVMVGPRKLCGILAEYVPTLVGQAWVVVGAGVNLTRPAVVEGVLAERGVWLNELCLGAKKVDLEEFVEQLNASVATRIASPAVETIVSDYRARCATLGQAVRVEQIDGSWEGVAETISLEGALVVSRPDGERRIVSVGDIVHLRRLSEES
jgi:BirA family transcriptional regulator, biotin operon repressor / biotin---[acetyl-CoA-carboxylase] ligase